MRHLGPVVVLVSFVAAAVAGDADPWVVPAPQGAELLAKLTESERSYSLNGSEKQWADSNGPERVALALSKEEKDGLAACRDLIAKGDHDGAGKALDGLLAKNAANWDAHLVRAVSLHARKADGEAAAALRTSLVGNRRSPDAWKLLDDVAAALSKKVMRPKLDVRGWVRDKGKGDVEVGSVFVNDVDFPWTYYGAARAVYRYEGAFARDFPAAKAYAFTFKEQMFAMSVLAQEAEQQRKDGKTNPAELKVVLAERKAGTLTPFTFFAVYSEPLTATPEKDFDALRPRLKKYFDERFLVRR